MDKQYRSVQDYFSLWYVYPVLGGKGTEQTRQIILFLGVIVGAICRVLYDFLAGGPLDWKGFAIAAIVSIVIFPQLYYSGGLNRKAVSFAHWAFAFQNGFFWSVALSKLTERLTQA